MGYCRCLLEKFEQFTLKHIYWEANGCTNILAKARCDHQVDFLRLSLALAYVLEALDFDNYDMVDLVVNSIPFYQKKKKS